MTFARTPCDVEHDKDGWRKARTGDQEERVDGGKVSGVRPVITICAELVSFSKVVVFLSGRLECRQLFSSITTADEIRRVMFVLNERDQVDGVPPLQKSVHLDLEGPPGSRERARLGQTEEVHHIGVRPPVLEVYLQEELEDVS